jgi:hypothetical protein
MELADSISSPDLAKDEWLDQLVGVPMLITNMEFRRGNSRKGAPNFVKGKREWNAYVTVTAHLAPVIDMQKVNMYRAQSELPPIDGWENIPFEPGGLVVFNDGSTGIYRMCVMYLEEKGMISLPEGNRGKAGKGESVFDTAPYEWQSADGATTYLSEDDGFHTADFAVRLAAKKGIRLSQYNNDTNPDGSQTRYLA